MTPSSSSPANFFAKFRHIFLTYLWQPTKTILCHLQILLLQQWALLGIAGPVESFNVFHLLILALNALVTAMVLYHFYDEIDDWAFLALKKEKEELNPHKSYYVADMDPDMADIEALYGDAIPHYEEKREVKQPTHLMKKAGWISAYIASVVSFAYMMGVFLAPVFIVWGVPVVWSYVIAYAAGGVVFGGFRLWRIFALNNTWRKQIDLVKPGQKKYASLITRILQAIAMLVGLGLICYYGGGVYALIVAGVFVFNLAVNFALDFPLLTVVLLIAFIVLLMLGRVRVLLRWKKFFKNMKKAKKAGEIDYAVEGNPYLAAMFPRLYVGLVVTDLQRYKGEPVTYRVAICNVKTRREAVILCDDYTIQVRHQINLRMGGRTLAIAAAAENTDGRTGHSLFQWYTTTSIEFPEGEGERILLVDPAPTKLYLRAGQTERLQEMDNGSRAYDYTVWTKNAFFKTLERM